MNEPKGNCRKFQATGPIRFSQFPCMVGKGKVYTIIDAKKITVHTVLVGDMNVLVSVAISNDEEPSDHEGDDFLFEDAGEEDAD